MEPSVWLPALLGIAVLLPLFSFVTIVICGPYMGRGGKLAGYWATLMIALSFAFSMLVFVLWISHHPLRDTHHGGSQETAEVVAHHDNTDGDGGHKHHDDDDQDHHAAVHPERTAEDDRDHGHDHHAPSPTKPYTGYWYRLGQFGSLHLDIGYYIDSLTVCMFCMVTLVATCIHFYALGYMHEELEDVTDHEVTRDDGSHLHRPGRFHRFFQYMSLFSFSMLGLVVSGNLAMTFAFWELVGICSYFLIGFYVERQSASTAANKAFIVNRIGDFGMIIGLMAIWTGLGTLDFGDVPRIDAQGQVVKDEHGATIYEAGIFSLIRPADAHHQLVVPDGMVQLAARTQVDEIIRDHVNHPHSAAAASSEVSSRTDDWRKDGYGYWLMIIAGVGIFCGCVGKSAQFPLHTWLPDAMEGPTPVSALVHSATMVAAGVFLVGRFYAFFVPEVLLIIAIVGCITLFLAATIAITATDIKRVLAYSTISQLGYMMLALGVGGWLAGMLHLFTHAFFKSLLFLCSGSVIHAVHTNEMTEMGGLRRKMPWTAYTMLIGCLAIAGASIPLLIGFSGYYSKDAILEQIFSFWRHNPANATFGVTFFGFAAGGAAITAFYMFRLWFMTFAGPPRDPERFEHAHESPPVMYIPLVVLAVFAVGVAWKPLFTDVNLANLLEAARPAGTAATVSGEMIGTEWPDEHIAHDAKNYMTIVVPVTLIAFLTALCGFFLALLFYGWRLLDPNDVRRQFRPIYRLLLNKWWFDELYDFLFVRPVLLLSRIVAGIDRRWIDGLVDGTAWLTAWFSRWGDRWIDTGIVDGLANLTARWTYNVGLSFRHVQTGRVRQYVMFIVLGTVAIFILITWTRSLAG